MEKINITVVGAGVIGLSVAYELSKVYQDIFVLERNSSFGQETSSRNSEVIHAGIYYPKNSLKTSTCIEGRQLLYTFCMQNDIPHKKTGKLIVATDDNEMQDLETLYKQGLLNGVDDLRLISGNEIEKMEPNIEAEAAIYSPSSGIIDSHSLMKTLTAHLQDQNSQIAYNSELVGMEKKEGGFEVSVKDKGEGVFKFFTRTLINCAGLNCERISSLGGLEKEEYRLKYCKGDYFRVSSQKAKLITRLVYPVPRKSAAGLGIHATLDLGGGLRLGPDDEYTEKIDYQVAPSKLEVFYDSACKFLPFLERRDLTPDMAGIRPKLQGPQEDFRDFIIQDETKNGLPGFINLIGIESPGLTACLSIARLVRRMTDKYQ